MSNTTEPTKFDFRKQSRLSSTIKEYCKTWFESFMQDFTEKWGQLTTIESTIEFSEQTTVNFDDARDRLRHACLGKELSIGQRSIRSFLVLEKATALAMIFGLLGEEVESISDDRQFSEIELSVGDMLFQKFADSISESWPQKDRLTCAVSAGLNMSPHKSRLWEPRQKVFVGRFAITIGNTTGVLQWILPLQDFEELLHSLDDQHVELSEEARLQMEQNASHIPTSVSVELGSTRVSVEKLTVLSVGDIVVLDQRIHEPLMLLVDSRPKFSGWLGRVGKAQAFKVSELK